MAKEKEFKGCRGCEFLRQYDTTKVYFCAAGSRTDGIDTLAHEKSGSKSVWPFKIEKPSDIKECNGYVEKKKGGKKK